VVRLALLTVNRWSQTESSGHEGSGAKQINATMTAGKTRLAHREGPWKWLLERSLTVPLILLLALRLPSLFEPHWYTDESSYATTAWLMAHGKILYLTVWDNKPPLLFWLYQLALGAFGPSEFGIHLVSTVTEGAALVATWRLARDYLAPGRTWVAMLLTAVFLATPIFNGDLALPENLLIAFTAWAMVCVLDSLRAPTRRRALSFAFLAGVLFAAASLIQQTGLADLAAGVLVMVLAGRRGWLPAGVTALATMLTVALVMAPFVAAARFHNVFFYLVTSYSSYTGASLHPSVLSLVPRALAGVLLLGGAYTARHWRTERLMPWVWLALLLLVYVLPNRPYLHFLLPAVPAASLLIARVTWPRIGELVSRARLAGGPLLASVMVSTVIWTALFVAGLSSNSLYTVGLSTRYYPAFAGRLVGALTPRKYAELYDRRVPAEFDAVRWIKQHHLGGSTAVVWSADVWAYLLGNLKPVLPEPTIYMDQLWLGRKLLFERFATTRPEVVILTDDSLTAFGPIVQTLRSDGYHEVESSADGQLWIRSDVLVRNAD
jgi:4-amino-4-deoxy-L-arabinose transferase-like glycosyltransferase